MIGRSFGAMVQAFFSAMPAFTYLVAGIVLHNGNLSPSQIAWWSGTVVAFTTLQSRLFFPIGSMLQVTVETHSSMALFERIFEYLDMTHEITDSPGAGEPAEHRGRGEVRSGT